MLVAGDGDEGNPNTRWSRVSSSCQSFPSSSHPHHQVQRLWSRGKKKGIREQSEGKAIRQREIYMTGKN